MGKTVKLTESELKNIISDVVMKELNKREETTIKIKDLRKFINQMEIEGLNNETVLTFETKRSSECIKKITSMEYSPTTNILIFS